MEDIKERRQRRIKEGKRKLPKLRHRIIPNPTLQHPPLPPSRQPGLCPLLVFLTDHREGHHCPPCHPAQTWEPSLILLGLTHPQQSNPRKPCLLLLFLTYTLSVTSPSYPSPGIAGPQPCHLQPPPVLAPFYYALSKSELSTACCSREGGRAAPMVMNLCASVSHLKREISMITKIFH